MARNFPLISAVLAVRNEAENPLFKTVLENVAKQTYPNIEFVIVDGNSTDRTPQILERFKTKYSKKGRKIVIIRDECNLGAHSSFSKGITHATGRYVAWIGGADDPSNVTRFKKQFEFLESHKDIAGVGTWFTFVNELGEIIGKMKPPTDYRRVRSEAYELAFNPAAIMMRRKVFRDIPLTSADDADVQWRFEVLSKGYKIANIPEYLTTVSRREGLSYKNRKKYLLAAFKTELRYLPFFFNFTSMIRIITHIIALILPADVGYSLSTYRIKKMCK